jgi:hypothetical protein
MHDLPPLVKPEAVSMGTHDGRSVYLSHGKPTSRGYSYCFWPVPASGYPNHTEDAWAVMVRDGGDYNHLGFIFDKRSEKL